MSDAQATGEFIGERRNRGCRCPATFTYHAANCTDRPSRLTTRATIEGLSRGVIGGLITDWRIERIGDDERFVLRFPSRPARVAYTLDEASAFAEAVYTAELVFAQRGP